MFAIHVLAICLDKCKPLLPNTVGNLFFSVEHKKKLKVDITLGYQLNQVCQKKLGEKCIAEMVRVLSNADILSAMIKFLYNNSPCCCT